MLSTTILCSDLKLLMAVKSYIACVLPINEVAQTWMGCMRGAACLNQEAATF